MEKNSCCVFGGMLSVVYYELLKPNEKNLTLYRTQLIRLSRTLKEKRAYYSRHDKIILLHDNARPHVVDGVGQKVFKNTQMGSSTRRILQTLLLPTTNCSDR